MKTTIIFCILLTLAACNKYDTNTPKTQIQSSISLSLTTGLEALPRGGWSGVYETFGATPFPLVQPFSTSPLSYSGQESITRPGTIWDKIETTGEIIDWIYVELRSTPSPSSIVAQRAGLLKSDGTVVDTNGTSALVFHGIRSGSYYIVIFYKGHLPLMSASPVNFSSNTTSSWDLTIPTNVYGDSVGYALVTGKSMMAAGDLNLDCFIEASDFPMLYDASDNSKFGYEPADLNLDGVVDGSDSDFLQNNSDNGKECLFSLR